MTTSTPVAAPVSALIEAVPVVRDANGEWWHPGMPEFEEGQYAESTRWIAAQGLATVYKLLEDEEMDHPVYVSYYDKEELSFAAWEPSPPAGEGWFTLAICDTEDGPCWSWARRAEGAAV
jgi:hypothetical protein